MPAVCSAIGSNKFEQIAHLTSINRTGPANGANVYFQFSLAAGPLPIQQAYPPIAARRTSMPTQTGKAPDLADALVLVSCVKSKRTHSVPARSLYTSPWFCKVRDIVEASGARWFVLSALTLWAVLKLPLAGRLSAKAPGRGYRDAGRTRTSVSGEMGARLVEKLSDSILLPCLKTQRQGRAALILRLANSREPR